MNKQAYLASLKRSLSGLPADQVADILGDYEQHFADAMARGRSELETARALGDPRKIALEFKAMAHLDAFQNKRSLANFGRMALTLVCVACFNMFLLVAPLMLLTFYLAAACLFGGGAALMASGVLRIDEIPFERDGRSMAVVVIKESDRMRAGLSDFRVQVSPYAITYVEKPFSEQHLAAIEETSGRQGTKTLFGGLYLAAGIAFFLLSQKLAGYVGWGTRRYLNVNINMMRGAKAR